MASYELITFPPPEVIMSNSFTPGGERTTRKNTIPFNIVCDKRTVEIASSILQQVTESMHGTAMVTALPTAISKSHLYGSIVLWVSESSARMNQLERFYHKEWCELPQQTRSKKYSLPVRWHILANDALTDLSKRFPYGKRKQGNKSLTFCVLMAFAAKFRFGINIPRD